MEQRIDVVIPCYRYGQFLETCVDSVLSQKDVDVRVLILDDASPDNTEEIGRGLASRDRRVTFRRHETNKGNINTYNEGIEWAGGELFLLLSADDYLLPGALDRAMRLMKRNPNVGFVFGNALIMHENGKMERICSFGVEDNVPASGLITGSSFIRRSGAKNIVLAPTAVTRTLLQKKLGGYRHDLTHSGDMEMWLRFASHAHVGYLNHDQAVYRRHQTNMSISYFADSMLPDLRQRRKALEMAIAAGGVALQDETTRAFLWRDLAREALKLAGMAFNNYDLEGSKVIEKIALEVDPNARRSIAWGKLAMKRAMGPRNWNALHAMLRPPGRN